LADPLDPFGRHRFAFPLMDLLDLIRADVHQSPKLVVGTTGSIEYQFVLGIGFDQLGSQKLRCQLFDLRSLRVGQDILIEHFLNQFDHLLIHRNEAFLRRRLDGTFDRYSHDLIVDDSVFDP